MEALEPLPLQIEATDRGEPFVVSPILHISFNYYGALGHCDSHASGPIPRRDDEDFRPGPVRILMRDGQRLQEPELVEACDRSGSKASARCG